MLWVYQKVVTGPPFTTVLKLAFIEPLETTTLIIIIRQQNWEIWDEMNKEIFMVEHMA